MWARDPGFAFCDATGGASRGDECSRLPLHWFTRGLAHDAVEVLGAISRTEA